MKILLKPIGDLHDYFGREPLEIQLPDNAEAKDLLIAIGERWGSNLPMYLWDSQKCTFRGPVFLVVDSKVLKDPHTPLRDGQEVVLLKALAGG
ncbi:MAG: MoaD/ThiS family protein [Anaerolineales bacterium]